MPDPTPNTIPRRWREGPSEDQAALRARARRRRVVTLQLLILGCAGAIVMMVLWVRPIPHPRFLPLWVARSQAPQVPSVPMAEPDLKLVTDRAGAALAETKNLDAQDRRAFSDGLLDRFKALGLVDAVVIYARANACVGGEPARVLILPADADPNDRRNWVELRSVLETLRDHGKARHKLLVLDIMPPLADPRLGILADDVAARVGADLDAVKDARRLTLCACSPGEVSLVSEELGRSVFNHYLEEGLRGWADAPSGTSARDGIVTARELARYVAAHVDRWARRNRGARQLPVLHGDARDFPLVALVRNRPQAHLTPPETKTYPEWLLGGWRLRDQWRADQSDRTAPWGFRRLEAGLLAAERDWRGGFDPARIEEERLGPVWLIEEQLRQARQVPQPKPARSLALTAALGRKPGAAASEALAALLALRDQQAKKLEAAELSKALEKPVADFLVRARAWSPFDLASAVFHEAATDPRPSAETILFLDPLLSSLQPEPQFAETLTLHRLATLARQVQEEKSTWPTSAARLALDVTRQGCQAESRMVPFPWVRPLLEEAAQLRHDAEIRLWEHGYTSRADAEQLLAKAAGEYATILKYEETILDAWHALDEALIALPPYSRYLEEAPALETAWYDAVREAQDLYAALAPPSAGTEGDFRLGLAELPARLEELGRQTQALRDHLDELLQPFGTAAVGQLVEQSKRPEADADLASEIEGLLAQPFAKAGDREALWSAARDLARRLNEETLAIDRQEGTASESAPEESATGPGDEAPSARGDIEAALRRARRSIALLGLAGFDHSPTAKAATGERPMTVESLTASVRRLSDLDAPAAERDQLAIDLQRAWSVLLPARFNQARDLAVRDRLSRLAPPFDSWPPVDDIKDHPHFQFRARLARNLWQWLAERATYEGRDLGNAALFPETAGGLRSLLLPSQSLNDAYVEIAPEPRRLELGASVTSATLRVRVNSPQSRKGTEVEILGPASDWLVIQREPGRSPSPSGEGETFRIDLKPLVRRTDALPPKGVLVRARVEGRSYHVRVPITLPEAVEPWQVLIGEGADAPLSAEGDLRLRPVKDRQAFTLALLNPSGRPRKVALEVKDFGSGIGATLSVVSQGTGKPERIGLTPPIAKPDAAPEPDLPDFVGPLQIRVLDEENQRKVLTTRLVGVSVASPLEYVRITEVRFDPPKPPETPNRLTLKLKAAAPLTGPPCPVELVLPPDRIPGFVAANDGTFLGTLPPDGQELRLFAENIQLRGNLNGQGVFHVNIDGVPRALVFRATFVRQGSPTTPRLDLEPEIRLKAASSAVPGSKYAVQVEADNAPYDALLEVSLGHFERGAFAADAETVRSTRKRHIGWGLLPTGSLVFETAVKDWNVPLRTAGIEGRRVVRARLLRADETEIKSVVLPLVLDESVPRNVRIVGLPPQARRGATVVLKAIGTPTESGTKQAVFFLGRPVKDALPPNTATIVAEPLDAAKTTWTAKVPLPEAARGPVDVSVQFINNVEKSAFATATTELTDGDPAPAPGTIRGTVSEGNRPQAKRKVFLYNAKGVARDQRETDAAGAFTFENLPAGRYGLATVKGDSRTRSQAIVEVKPGEETSAALKLRR